MRGVLGLAASAPAARGMTVCGFALCAFLVLSACGTDELIPSQSSAPGVANGDHRVIVGIDENHVIITEPLVEVLPRSGAHDASLTFDLEQTDPPTLLGIEGVVYFLRARDRSGSVVMDRILRLEGDTVSLPPGIYRLEAYYRACDGNCGLLDPPHQLCATDAALQARTAYLFVVAMHRAVASVCGVEPAEGTS